MATKNSAPVYRTEPDTMGDEAGTSGETMALPASAGKKRTLVVFMLVGLLVLASASSAQFHSAAI